MSNHGMADISLRERRYYVGNQGWRYGALDESAPDHGLDG
jgi:hypothetical protein